MTGADVVGQARLPTKGPAIVVANHNSHVDTLLLLALFSPFALQRVRPVAATDYFLANPVIGWFSRNVVAIVPVERARSAPATTTWPLEERRRAPGRRGARRAGHAGLDPGRRPRAALKADAPPLRWLERNETPVNSPPS